VSRPTRPPDRGAAPEVREADDVARAALEVFVDVGPRTMLLAGGSTPRRLYELMAGAAPRPWTDVEVFFGDERCVPPGDARSNAAMAREALLSKVPARSYPIDGGACDAEGYERTLQDRFGDALAFDLAVYGLGPDGHTASLFPGRPEVDVVDRRVVRVPEAGWEPFVPRVSLTLPALSSAAVGLLLATGEEKREPLRRLLGGEPIPAARLRPERFVVIADHTALGA